MGYRSDVGLCLTANGRQVLSERLAALEAGADKAKHIHELLDNCPARPEDQESGAAAWLWEEIKWYADYDGVAFVENLLQNLDDGDYLFIRIGEAEDDTEYRGGYWENPFEMCLARSIAFD